MNHKKSLEFPTDVELSESAKLLICGLLDEQKQRFGYQELAKHEFFKSIDWTTLKDFKPPYIPQLKDSRDTSHFEKFTSSKICSANPITANLANTIPFLGFTFTKSLSEAKDLSTSAKHSISHRCSLSEDPDRKINQFSEQLTQNLEALQQKLREQETQMKSLEFEKSNLSNQLAVKNSTLGVLENQFSSLTAERDKLKCNLECLMTEVSEVTSLKSTIRTLNDELESEKKRLEDVMSECEVIRVKLSKSTSENEQLSSKLKNFDITIKDLQNNISKNS
ncbi:Rho-associated protein kinase let-502 [Thelohanellus kitauei]|uniref:non-specific serine/threonine protein kinase n=1 Tax=Thelohanellus kitauei TaxID=669202 RepID=A0A0C2IXP1_THEKT|nr:Rho-associated protein kinase let-502 [Thelohanellus kitauei]